MYIWIGLILEKEDENYIREICKVENKSFNVNEQAFTLPQHISLKTSFNVNEYAVVIEYLKEELKDINTIELEADNLTVIDGKVIWLDIKENKYSEKVNIDIAGDYERIYNEIINEEK